MSQSVEKLEVNTDQAFMKFRGQTLDSSQTGIIDYTQLRTMLSQLTDTVLVVLQTFLRDLGGSKLQAMLLEVLTLNWYDIFRKFV